MSTLTKICFDASIHNNCVGIGIFNFDTKDEEYHRYSLPREKINSTIAESMALVQTLKYMERNKIKSAHLFTDNKPLAERGIERQLLKKFKDVTLTWIPREFNEDADRLSKRAHELSGFKLRFDKLSKVMIKNPLNTKKINVLKEIKKYPLNKKINLILKWSRSKRTDSLLASNLIKNKLILNKKDKTFLKLLKTIINEDEINLLINKDIIKEKLIKIQKYNNISLTAMIGSKDKPKRIK